MCPGSVWPGAPIVGEGSFEQWVYAGADNDFLQNHQFTGQFPSEDLLSPMFTPWQDDSGTTHAPLFSILQFAVEAYKNATLNTQAVTHVFGSASDSGGATHTSNSICPAK